MPFPSGYKPELDTMDKLDDNKASRFQQLIGVLHWVIELSRVDILYEVSVLSQYLAMPQVRHLEAVYHIFAYLAKHENSCIVFDPMDPNIDLNTFMEVDWLTIYDLDEVKEEIPPNMPKLRGNSMSMSAFVNANHVGNMVTHHSHTGILIYLQNAPMIWYSK